MSNPPEIKPETKHLSLSELQASVARALEGAFPLPVWVTAEIAEMKVTGAGHCYLELVEKAGAGSAGGAASAGAVPKASARAVVWRSGWASLSAYFRGVTGSALEAGMKVLLKVHVSYHELYGFSLVVTDIDPSYTLGEAQRQRQLVIARLKADGVWDMNRSLEVPPVIQRIAVVSSSGAAGLRDFVQELGRYPFRFETTLIEAVMQGLATEGSVVEALENIAERADEFDVVVLIRGGGSTSDLAAFDGYRLCSHIAQFPLPVVTGIGHDKDRSVADMVAWREMKTPTAVAVWLGEGLAAFARLLDGFEARVSEAASEVLRTSAARLESFSRVVSIGVMDMTRRLEVRLERLSGEVARRSGEYFLREDLRLSRSSDVARERPGMFLSRALERLATAERVVALRRPENILALGFAIVRAAGSGGASGSDGVLRAVTDPAELMPGQPLEITLAKGKTKAKKI